jgi:ribosomal protein S18 acetylase RimI-like enzyme
MDVSFIEIKNDEDLQELSILASEIWHEYFPGIISDLQVDYMVEKYQSYDAIRRQITEGYEYYFVKEYGFVLGYIGIHCEPEKLFLSKLYLKREYRGKGLFHAMLSFCENVARSRGLHAMYLTVNRENKPTIAVYLKKGFHIVSDKKADIGNGFFMDDHIMEKSL